MDTQQLGIVVLAAGEGTRMRSALPKVLHEICGRSLLGHVLALADELAARRTAVVLAANTIDQIRAHFGERYSYATQVERRGTGHAVQQAHDLLIGQSDDVLVLYGDAPLLRAESARKAIAARRAQDALLCLLSFEASPPTGYGRVVRDADGQVAALVEERNATPEQRAITEVNSGIICFQAAWLWASLPKIQPNPVNHEYYLTDLIELAVAERGPGAALALPVADAREAWGVNDRIQLAQAGAALRERILEALMRSGVTIVDPASTYVDADVSVGGDTVLLPGTLLQRGARIGAGCRIGPHTTISNATVGDRAQIRHALVEHTTVPDHADIGPFVYLTGNM